MNNLSRFSPRLAATRRYSAGERGERILASPRSPAEYLRVAANRFIATGLFPLILLTLLGCSPASDSDARLVDSERNRLTGLADPHTLTEATKPPAEVIPDDHGRWTGPITTQQATTQPATQPVLRLTIEQAVLMALDRNHSLVVERYAPQISQFSEDASLAPFDPTLTGNLSYSRSGLAIAPAVPDFQTVAGQAQIQQFFATGTTVALNVTPAYEGTNLYGDNRTATGSVRIGGSVTQSLLQGAGIRFNLASIRQAQLDVLTSQYELRGFAEQLASDTEQAYLDYILNQRELDIAITALVVAQTQLDEVNAMIDSGRSASSDRAAALATVEQRNEDIINARATLEQTRLRFVRLVNPASGHSDTAWDVFPKLTQPPVPVGKLDNLDAHIRVASVYRSDLNQARLQIERGDLDIVKTRNGLLPRLDLFASLGRTWYSHYPEGNGYANPTSYDATVGLNFAYPLYNRAARAAFNISRASHEQAIEALANLQQSVEFDVRSSYQEALRAEEQITASAATLVARQAALDVEQVRYRVGKSTSLLVSIAQQGVLDSENAQATAVASYLKGLVDLYRLEGSLLERRGVVSMDYPPKSPAK